MWLSISFLRWSLACWEYDDETLRAISSWTASTSPSAAMATRDLRPASFGYDLMLQASSGMMAKDRRAQWRIQPRRASFIRTWRS